MATINQHEAIKKLIQSIAATESHVPDDIGHVVMTTIELLNKDDLLPDLISEGYEAVSTRQASWAMTTLINLARMTKPYVPQEDKSSQYPGIPPGYEYVFKAKMGGKQCVVCDASITIGVDWTAKVKNGYENYCVSCANRDLSQWKNPDESRLEVAMQYPGLHLAGNKVYRVDSDGVHVRYYGAQFRRVTRNLPALDASTLMSAERARAYAQKHKRCIACGENIGQGTTRRSLAAGYGPVCAKRYGWPYPTEQEAENILSADTVSTP